MWSPSLYLLQVTIPYASLCINQPVKLMEAPLATEIMSRYPVFATAFAAAAWSYMIQPQSQLPI
jgi:hypothetical protein